MSSPLHALIAQWREKASQIHYSQARADAFKQCADELEALLASSALRDEEGQQTDHGSPGSTASGNATEARHVAATVQDRPTIQQLREIVSMLANFIWTKQLRPGEHLWSIPADPSRDFDLLLSRAIDELANLRKSSAVDGGPDESATNGSPK